MGSCPHHELDVPRQKGTKMPQFAREQLVDAGCRVGMDPHFPTGNWPGRVPQYPPPKPALLEASERVEAHPVARLATDDEQLVDHPFACGAHVARNIVPCVRTMIRGNVANPGAYRSRASRRTVPDEISWSAGQARRRASPWPAGVNEVGSADSASRANGRPMSWFPKPWTAIPP
jgi:hypothetical protein